MVVKDEGNPPKFRFRNCRKILPSYIHTVDGRKPAPVDMVNIPLFIGFLHPRWCRIFFHQTVAILYNPPRNSGFFRLFRARTEFSGSKRNVDVKEFHDSASKTLPKIEMSENWWLEDALPIEDVPFFWTFVHFRGCIVRSWKKIHCDDEWVIWRKSKCQHWTTMKQLHSGRQT